MKWYDDNTMVLFTKDIEKTKNFFECLGLTFVCEQHGEGPEHYACERDGRVLEIYPKKNKVP